jgi:hypothetical protein
VAERVQLENKFGKLPVWPVIGLTLTHRFWERRRFSRQKPILYRS